MKKITLNAIAENCKEVLKFINIELKSINCPTQYCNYINLVTKEVFSNIAKYAYASRDEFSTGEVAISICLDEYFTLTFEDSGKQFNPLEDAPTKIEGPLITQNEGRRGIVLIKGMVDKGMLDGIEYKYANNKNVLIIKKRIGEII